MTVTNILLIILNILFIPFLLMGVIRKVKALMQNRIGPSIFQPFYDFVKLLKKGETISETASYIFLFSPRICLVVALITGVLIPWSGTHIPDTWGSATNFILIIYLLGLGKFFSLLSAMDTGSSFGGLGASREAYLSIMVEPALIIGIGGLALSSGSMNLCDIFTNGFNPFVGFLSGVAFLIISLAELSRMPVDDPTTHLELTMIHEAMILENSGRNLALVEYTVYLRTCIFLGLSAQTFLNIIPNFKGLPLLEGYIIGIAALLITGIFVAVAEGFIVRLSWRKIPNFIAYAVVLSILAALVAVAHG